MMDMPIPEKEQSRNDGVPDGVFCHTTDIAGRRFDGGVERQQVGLMGNGVDEIDYGAGSPGTSMSATIAEPVSDSVTKSRRRRSRSSIPRIGLGVGDQFLLPVERVRPEPAIVQTRILPTSPLTATPRLR